MKALLEGSKLLGAYEAQFRAANEVSLVMPLVTTRGIRLLRTSIHDLLKRSGTLKILLGLDMFTDPAAVQRLLDISDRFPGRCSLRCFESSPPSILHAKMAIFEGKGRRAAIVGSSNFTSGGFVKNYEASLLTKRREPVESLKAYFTELFSGNHAVDVDRTWLRSYRQWRKTAKKLLSLRRKLQRKRPHHLVKKARPALATLVGKRLAFTGTIRGWPRERRLYPEVRRLGGEIANRAKSMASADALIKGNILDRESTKKIKAAEDRGIPTLSVEHFFRLRDKAAGRKRQ